LIRVGFGGVPYFRVPVVGFALMFLVVARFTHQLTGDEAR